MNPFNFLAKRHQGMDHDSMDHGSMAQDGGHSHSHGGGNSACKFSMVFHTTTIDSCFLSDKWHVTSSGKFAGSCIAVFLLAFTLEFVRRAVKEYDVYLARQHLSRCEAPLEHSHSDERNKEMATTSSSAAAAVVVVAAPASFRPTFWQQAARAFLQLLLITCAWTLMLLVMYFNVYLTLCILLGFYIGAFVFQWENIPLKSSSPRSDSALCCS